MRSNLEIGRKYRIKLGASNGGACVEGLVRSLTLPPGVLGNLDGEHQVWIAGEMFDWFLRAEEIDGAQEIPHDLGWERRLTSVSLGSTTNDLGRGADELTWPPRVFALRDLEARGADG